jgi:hypothetical protein
MENTTREYEQVMAACRLVFEQKMGDYGPAWRVLRPASLTDQIYIKASRIRSIENKATQKIEEGIIPEFIGMVNYALMALIQLEEGAVDKPDMSGDQALLLYDQMASKARELMENKNHDYGEAWRQMRVSSLTDIILMKLLRIKQIEDNEGKTQVSEGPEGSFFDIVNYAVFALIKLKVTENNITY